MSFIKEVSLIKTCLETKENKKPEEKPKFAAKRKASSGKTNERGAGFGGAGEEGGLPTCVQVRQVEIREPLTLDQKLDQYFIRTILDVDVDVDTDTFDESFGFYHRDSFALRSSVTVLAVNLLHRTEMEL
ncbi:hypothetical protein RUM43_011634 [Polyplax serrata]|uniref:Uncharacterized protein n=1 Tax=Polyplax serrata TaxID=468196 RepID=A0AAN8PUW0_POLSC